MTDFRFYSWLVGSYLGIRKKRFPGPRRWWGYPGFSGRHYMQLRGPSGCQGPPFVCWCWSYRIRCFWTWTLRQQWVSSDSQLARRFGFWVGSRLGSSSLQSVCVNQTLPIVLISEQIVLPIRSYVVFLDLFPLVYVCYCSKHCFIFTLSATLSFSTVLMCSCALCSSLLSPTTRILDLFSRNYPGSNLSSASTNRTFSTGSLHLSTPFL